jgi:hypothetical protein
MSSPNGNNNSFIDNAVHATKDGLQKTREFVHEATKSPEEKEAGKSIGTKIQDKLPDSGEETGTAIGKKVDEAAKDIKERMDEAKKNSSN